MHARVCVYIHVHTRFHSLVLLAQHCGTMWV